MTRDVRAAFQLLIEKRLDDLDGWLDEVGRRAPYRALQTVIGLAEFIIPKLSRAELHGAGEDGKLIVEIRTLGGSDGQTDGR